MVSVKVRDDRVSAEKSQQAERQEGENTDVEHTSFAHCAAEPTMAFIWLDVRIMEVIVGFLFSIHGVPRIRIGKEVRRLIDGSGGAIHAGSRADEGSWE